MTPHGKLIAVNPETAVADAENWNSGANRLGAWIRGHKEFVKQGGLFLGIFIGIVWVNEPSRYYFFGDSWGVLYGFLVDLRTVVGFHNEHFTPLFNIFYLLEYKIFGPHHLPYELVLLAMHACAAVLVYKLGRRLCFSPRSSEAAAIIFAFSSVLWSITGFSYEQLFVSGIALGLASTHTFLGDASEKHALMRSAVLSLIGFWFGGPIVLAFTLALTAHWILHFASMGLARKEKPFKLFAALWGPPVIYFLSYHAAEVYGANILNNPLPVGGLHLHVQDLPSIIDYVLEGAVNGAILPALSFVHPEALLSATTILIILALLSVACYGGLDSNQRTAFWFLTFLFLAPYFVIALGRLRFGVQYAASSRYQYQSMASLALILVLCWNGLRRRAVGKDTPLWWHGLSILLLGSFLIFHSYIIRKDNPFADRGKGARSFLKIARQATYPLSVPTGSAILGPELPVPFDVIPIRWPLWMIFQVLEGNTRSVVPVGNYLANEKAIAPFNLVRDGGFEEPIGADWLSYGGAQFTQTPQAAHSGQFGASVVLHLSSAFSQDVISNCSAPLVAKIFTFAIEAKTSSPNALKARIIFKGRDNAILSIIESLPHPGDNQWHQLLISGLSPQGTCTVGVDITNGSNSALTASVDDALLVLHPGTVDARGNVTFQAPDVIAAPH